MIWSGGVLKGRIQELLIITDSIWKVWIQDLRLSDQMYPHSALHRLISPHWFIDRWVVPIPCQDRQDASFAWKRTKQFKWLRCWRNPKCLFHCRCSRLQGTSFRICFRISPPSYHILDSNMKCSRRSKKVTGLNPKPQQAFLCTVSILSSYLRRFPRGALVSPPPIKGIQAGLAHTGGTGSCSASGLTSIWPANVAVRLLYFFVCCLSLLRVHVRLCSQPRPAQTCSLSPVKGKQSNQCRKIQSRLDQPTSTVPDWNVWPFCNYLSARYFMCCFMVGWYRAPGSAVPFLTCPPVLQLTARSLPAVHSDERLQPLLTHLR